MISHMTYITCTVTERAQKSRNTMQYIDTKYILQNLLIIKGQVYCHHLKVRILKNKNY